LRENNVATLDDKTRIVLGSPHGGSADWYIRLHCHIHLTFGC
jgi:hypothetical protein